MHDSETLRTHLPCPDCGSSDALSEYTDGHTYCFSCQKERQGERKHIERRKTVALKLFEDLTEYPQMHKRKLTEDTLRKFNYKQAEKEGRKYHVAPYFNKEGELVAQHLRGANKTFKWAGTVEHLQLFGQQLWNNNTKRVIVTEGEIDCMTVSQIQENKWPVVSIPSGVNSAMQSFKDNLEWLEGFENVVICFDSDEVGRKAASEAAAVLSPGKALIAKLPLKDPSDMYVAGRGKELTECLWQAAPYRPDGIVSGVDLWDEILKEPEKGRMTPFAGLNKLTQGVRNGELWLFTAGSGIGKSTFVHEIGYKFLQEDNIKLGVLALEESKRRTAERYLSIYLDKPLHIDRDGISEAKLKDAYDKTVGKRPCCFELYDHFGSTDVDNLLGKMRYMFVGLGVDIIILDHISIVVSGLEGGAISEGERRTLDVLMTKLRSLVQETGKTVIAVAHLKRPEQGKSWNEGREPRLTDLRGSASLEQLSDMVVALYRDQTDEEAPNRANILVLKNRPIGLTGDAGEVEYNPETGRLKDADPFKTSMGKPAEVSDDDEERDF